MLTTVHLQLCPAYNIENYNQKNLGASAMRQKFNAIVTERDLADTYLPPFRGCVAEAKGAAVMCTYSGEYVCIIISTFPRGLWV